MFYFGFCKILATTCLWARNSRQALHANRIVQIAGSTAITNATDVSASVGWHTKNTVVVLQANNAFVAWNRDSSEFDKLAGQTHILITYVSERDWATNEL